MKDDHRNPFVVQTESGHPGYVHYTVISTRDGMQDLTHRLAEALAAEPGALRQEGESAKDPLTLFSQYATIAHGQRSRVSLAFQVVEDLEPYHVTRVNRPGRVQLLALLLIVVALLYFAIVGLYATVAP